MSRLSLPATLILSLLLMLPALSQQRFPPRAGYCAPPRSAPRASAPAPRVSRPAVRRAPQVRQAPRVNRCATVRVNRPTRTSTGVPIRYLGNASNCRPRYRRSNYYYNPAFGYGYGYGFAVGGFSRNFGVSSLGSSSPSSRSRSYRGGVRRSGPARPDPRSRVSYFGRKFLAQYIQGHSVGGRFVLADPAAPKQRWSLSYRATPTFREEGPRLVAHVPFQGTLGKDSTVHQVDVLFYIKGNLVESVQIHQVNGNLRHSAYR